MLLLLVVKFGGPEAGHWKKDLITWMESRCRQ